MHLRSSKASVLAAVTSLSSAAAAARTASLAGPAAGRCSGENWYDKPQECSSSCVHTALLNWVPYSAVWRAGHRAKPWDPNAQLPHYISKERSQSAIASMSRLFEDPMRVMLGTYCRSMQIKFVGVSLFSPHYEAKAARLKSYNE